MYVYIVLNRGDSNVRKKEKITKSNGKERIIRKLWTE
jgi:hypothetical protein